MDDPGSSLGYGYFTLIFWIVAAVILILLLIKKIIYPQSVPDKIGVFTATPVLCIVFITVMLSFKDNVGSEWCFTKSNYRYKVITYNYSEPLAVKRVEYYRSADTINSKGTLMDELWIKGSIWIYLSRVGDTVKKVTYKNDIEIK
ncbi:hypothetical protein [Filimonas effusa]|uniref:Uncharacterized protein n=1 Tax=Filimonas effusa TaxID=2508721 RepID=A0A4Q1CZ32_9BACT|nr:hypothetical protein [Filimonas effusa]RXK80482.1 hypothetical protein ESB13_23575 [Filimonas effusa]